MNWSNQGSVDSIDRGESISASALHMRVRLIAIAYAVVAIVIPTWQLTSGKESLFRASAPLYAGVLGLAAFGYWRRNSEWSLSGYSLWAFAIWFVQFASVLASMVAGGTNSTLGFCLALAGLGAIQLTARALALSYLVAGVASVVVGWIAFYDAVIPLILVGGLLPGVVLFAGFHHYTKRMGELLVEQRRLNEETRAAAERLASELEERRRAEAEREQLRESFLQSQKMEAVGRLAGGVAHDVNNVMAAIRGLAEVMLADAPASMREDLESIVESCERGADLTKNLLGFSRRGSYERALFDAADVVTDVTRLLSRTVPRRISIVVNKEEGNLVEGDRSQLTHALINVCINAIDAMRDTGTLTVSVGNGPPPAEMASRGGELMVRIVVTDTGCGIDEATKARMFEPFFTTKPKGEGTGLGLSMVYGTVQAHGGSIDVDSQVGRGTTMTVYLPCASRDAAAKTPVAVAAEKTAGVRRGTVLIIDDDAMVRRFMQRLVSGQGCEVLCAERAEEGIALAEARPGEIDCVILDMQMPGMGGAAGFRALRTLSPALPIILVSGYAELADVQRCLSEGATTFLQKPFDIQRLSSTLSEVITAKAA